MVQAAEHNKLPYNDGDNMLVTGEKFCGREGVHKSMLEQITQFLRQQTQGGGSAPTLGQASGNSGGPKPAAGPAPAPT